MKPVHVPAGTFDPKKHPILGHKQDDSLLDFSADDCHGLGNLRYVGILDDSPKSMVIKLAVGAILHGREQVSDSAKAEAGLFALQEELEKYIRETRKGLLMPGCLTAVGTVLEKLIALAEKNETNLDVMPHKTVVRLHELLDLFMEVNKKLGDSAKPFRVPPNPGTVRRGSEVLAALKRQVTFQYDCLPWLEAEEGPAR